MTFDGDLNSILSTIQPNILTPHLVDISSASAAKKPKLIAKIIVKSLADSLDKPVTKEIIHDGKIHKVSYLDVEPLLTGSWSMISLMMLSLSYGEQSTIIESIYPKKLQLIAKSFAITFTKAPIDNTLKIEPDEKLMQQVESANAGIALILAKLTSGGIHPHADEIKKQKSTMDRFVKDMHESKKYQTQHNRSQQANKHRDVTK